MRRLLCGVVVAGATLGLASSPAARGQSTLTWALDLVAEADDNVTLGNGVEQEEVDDTVYRVVPRIEWAHRLEDHLFSLDLSGTFREGQDTALSDQNLNAAGRVDLSFAGGLGLSLYDYFLDAEFDQALYAPEAGVTTTSSNLLGGEVSYEPRERLRIVVGYELLSEDFGTVVGARDVDRASGRLEVPVAQSLAVYGDYTSAEQTSNDQPTRDFSRRRWAGGLLWAREGSRFSAWAEAGRQQIDFVAPLFGDYEGTVFEVGSEVRFSESSTLSASLGRDGYGHPVGNLVLAYEEPDDLLIQLSALRETRHLFVQSSLVGTDPVYESTVVLAEVSKFFAERFRLDLRSSYLIFDAAARQDDTVSARLRFTYLMRDWLHLGAHYEHGSKASSDPVFEFDLNRVGIFLVFTRTHG